MYIFPNIIPRRFVEALFRKRVCEYFMIPITFTYEALLVICLSRLLSECIYHIQHFNTSPVWVMGYGSPDSTVADSAEKLTILSIPVWSKQRGTN